MNDTSYKKFLTELTELLKPDLVVTDLLILDEFVAKGYLTPDDDSSIRKLRRQKKQVAEFVRLLGKSRNPSKCFDLLLTCLESTNAYLAPQVRSLLYKYAGCLEEKSGDQRRHQVETDTVKRFESLGWMCDNSLKINNHFSSNRLRFCSSNGHKRHDKYPVQEEMHFSVRVTDKQSSSCSNPETVGCRQELAPAEMSRRDFVSHIEIFELRQQNQNCLALLNATASFQDWKSNSNCLKHTSCHVPIPDFKNNQDRIPIQMSCHEWNLFDRNYNREEQIPEPTEMSWQDWGSNSSVDCHNPEPCFKEQHISTDEMLHSMPDHPMELSNVVTKIRPIIMRQQNREPVQLSYDTLYSHDIDTSTSHSDGCYDEAKIVPEQQNRNMCKYLYLETEYKDQNNNLNSMHRDGPTEHDSLDDTNGICKSIPNVENYQHLDTVSKTCTCCLTEVLDSKTSASDEHSSESETNTEIGSSDLESDEQRVLACLQDVDVIELVDACIAHGYLSSDDHNAVKDLTDHKKKVFLSRMVCDKTNLDEIGISWMLSLASVRPCNGVSNFVRKVNDKQFNVVFDELNLQLNTNMKFDEVVENDELKRFVNHTLCAFLNLYELNTDAAEHQIDQADEIIKKTNQENKELFKSEIFSAKTWLYLRSGRIGLMLSMLEENEQHLEILKCWSAKTVGWFYYDYSRCCSELLKCSYSSANINYRNIETIRERGIRYALKARDYFKSSKSTDGPIGQGFALCLFAKFQLKFDKRFGYFHFLVSDSEKDASEKGLEYVETKLFGKFSEVPDVLKVDLLISRCDSLVLNKRFREAVTCLTKAECLCQTLNLQDMQRQSLDRLAHLKKYI